MCDVAGRVVYDKTSKGAPETLVGRPSGVLVFNYFQFTVKVSPRPRGPARTPVPCLAHTNSSNYLGEVIDRSMKLYGRRDPEIKSTVSYYTCIIPSSLQCGRVGSAISRHESASASARERPGMVLLALCGMASALHTPTCTVAARWPPSCSATPRARPLMQSVPPAESTLSSARLLKV